MNKVKAFDINWDVDTDELFETLDNMSDQDGAEWLDVSTDEYNKMPVEKRHGLLYDIFHHNRKSVSEFFGLPEEIDIPDSISDDEDMITDWISDTFGFCINGYRLSTD